jgi:3-deoxy-D-manno-octulosonate 8-phosphate phosphatase (KDO 8-P phosphatase)
MPEPRAGRTRGRGPRLPDPPVEQPKAPSPESVVRELIEATPGVAVPETLPAPRLVAPVEGPVQILFMDLDGTLTDGVITFDHLGDQRHFSIRDGLALQWASELGVLPVVISGRPSLAAELRMRDLKLEHYLGVSDKVAVAEEVRAREGADWKRCVMVGDDLPDLQLMKRVGWSIAVADAVAEIKAIANTITRTRAGVGAIREVVEMLLRHNGVWERVLERYGAR